MNLLSQTKHFLAFKTGEYLGSICSLSIIYCWAEIGVFTSCLLLESMPVLITVFWKVSTPNCPRFLIFKLSFAFSDLRKISSTSNSSTFNSGGNSSLKEKLIKKRRQTDLFNQQFLEILVRDWQTNKLQH